MSLNPKYEEFLKQDFDSLFSLGVDKMRAIYAQMMNGDKSKAVQVGSIEDRTVETSIRDTLIRIYRPKGEDVNPVVIWMHGGGFVLGDIEHGDATCRELCSRVPCTVISIEYGLCPPYKFPQPENECYEVVRWVYQNAKELRIDPNKICVAGDSAGGTLAAVISHLSRDRKEFPLVYQVLVYGCFDWNNIGKRKSRIENGEGYRLTSYSHEWHNFHHLKDRSEGLDPMCSPLLSKNFNDLPPALIITAEYDLLRDESIDYAKALTDAGVPVYLKNYEGAIHGFMAFKQLDLDEAKDAMTLMCDQVREAFNK
jgi:acetyl esterase